MEICNNGTLIMPSNYAVLNTEEMTYVEGGYYLNQSNCNAIAFALGVTASMNMATVEAIIATKGASYILASMSTIPVIGWIVGAYGGVIVLRSAEQFSSALVTSLFYKKGMDISLGFSWFTPYLKCVARTKK